MESVSLESSICIANFRLFITYFVAENKGQNLEPGFEKIGSRVATYKLTNRNTTSSITLHNPEL